MENSGLLHSWFLQNFHAAWLILTKLPCSMADSYKTSLQHEKKSLQHGKMHGWFLQNFPAAWKKSPCSMEKIAMQHGKSPCRSSFFPRTENPSDPIGGQRWAHRSPALGQRWPTDGRRHFLRWAPLAQRCPSLGFRFPPMALGPWGAF